MKKLTYEQIKQTERTDSLSRNWFVNGVQAASAVIDTELEGQVKEMAIDQFEHIANQHMTGEDIYGMLMACIKEWRRLNDAIK